MKVLLLNGSPRAEGCTYTALAEVAGALNACSIETEIIHVAAGAVRGCSVCLGCRAQSQDGCVYEEDKVNEVRVKMRSANGLVVGAPVYYAAPNGALLSFLNRMFYAGTSDFQYKPGAAIVSARRAGTTASLDVLNKYFLISNMPLVPSLYWNMVHGNTPDEVRRDEEGMQIMRTLGRNMAWMIQCFANGDKPPKPEKERMRTNFMR
ncbi:MAG: flavodoxin family protein [Clostridia bacterium]|nr:flavodoxin family protein [Clostridia bacterium]